MRFSASRSTKRVIKTQLDFSLRRHFKVLPIFLVPVIFWLLSYFVIKLNAFSFFSFAFLYSVSQHITYVSIKFNVEWTATITKYLKDQLNKLSDFYHQSFQRMSADVELAQKQWHYTVRLTDWLYEVGLLTHYLVRDFVLMLNMFKSIWTRTPGDWLTAKIIS